MDTLTRLTELDPRQVTQLVAIYEDSFPPEERTDLANHLDWIADGSRWLYAALRDDTVIGFALFVPHVALNIHLLEFLAVSRTARNGGLGGILLDHVAQKIDGDIILEVESDDEGDKAERVMRQRRIGFYQRHGAKLITAVPYYSIPRSDGLGTIAMKLMWLSPRGADIPRAKALRECVIGIYLKSYGLDPRDLLIAQIVNGIAA